MHVVNCKVSFIRPEYKNLKEWMDDPNNVYIGRRGIVFIDGERFPKYDSPFANPFKIGKNGNRDEVLQLYKDYIIEKLANDKSLNNLLLDMHQKNKNLGCWCHPEPCHGDILCNIANCENKKL